MAFKAKEKDTTITAFVFDFETGGLDCQKCAATQLAVHAVRTDTFELMETFNVYFTPYDYQQLEKPARKVLKTKYELEENVQMEYGQVALSYSGITMDMLYNKGVDLTEGCNRFLDFVERNTFNVKPVNKPFLVGQNVLFDIGFLTQILQYTRTWDRFAKLVRGHKDYWGHFQPYYVDTILFCQLAIGHEKDIPNWKLEVEAERLGIDLDDAHDADADVTATREILRTLTARMRSGDANVGLAEVKREKTRNHFKI